MLVLIDPISVALVIGQPAVKTAHGFVTFCISVPFTEEPNAIAAIRKHF